MTEGPYELPAGWRWVRLGEVLEKPQYGYTASASENRDGPRFVRVTDLAGDGSIKWESVPHCVAADSVLQKYRLRLGDTLIARSGSVGKTALVDSLPEEAVFGSYLIRLRAEAALLPNYLIWFFQCPYYWEQVELRGSAQVNINAKMIQQFVMPLPPLSEQRRIVAQVEALMGRIQEGRRLRQQAKEETERLWQSILADAFPKPGAELPAGSRWVRLGEVFDIQQGVSMSPRRRAGQSPKPFLRTKNILWGSIDLSTVDEMDFSQEEAEKLRLRPGDLLVCEGGDVGRCAVWEGALPLVLYQNHIHRLRRTDAETDPHLVRYWMEAAYEVFGAYEGTESRTAIPNLSANRLKNFRFPLPPIIEQGRIVDRLHQAREHIDELKAAQEETEARLKTLEQSILDKAFRGKL
jgi:type I restriction enzyme S subunit